MAFRIYKRTYIRETEGRLNKCGLEKWLGELITLELEHIDGNNQNNRRENLEFLCPNCHSLTVTWRGRNKNKDKRKKISDEELTIALKGSVSIRQALIKVGMSPKGNNYLRAKKLMGL